MPSLTKTETAERTSVARVACLVSIASVLQISESLIPHPVPGVRLGLANMITLVALADLGFGAALEIAVLRTVISSFILGTFLTPTFVLSFGSALASTIIMYGLYVVSSRLPRYGFSLIGISIIGAMVHNISQIILAYYLLVKHPGIFYFLPVLMISAIVMGFVTGLVAVQVLLRLRRTVSPAPSESAPATETPFSHMQVAGQGSSWLHRLAPQWKILATLGLAVLALLLSGWRSYAVSSGSLMLVMLSARAPIAAYGAVLSRIRRMGSLIFISFIFPVLFGSNGHKILADLGLLKITSEGLAGGTLLAVRIMFLVWITYLLNYFTRPEDMSAGISRVLYPLKLFGLPVNRIGAVTSAAWANIPLFWEKARLAIRHNHETDKTAAPEKWMAKTKRIVNSLASLITSLYRQSEQVPQ